MTQPRNPWHHWPNRALAAAEHALLTLVLGAMVLLAFSQVLLRLFHSPLALGIDPILRHLVLWAALAGAIVATREEKNITIDVVSRSLPPRARTAVRAVTDAFSAVVCALLARATWQTVVMEREFAAMAFGQVPAWIAELIMPLGFGIIAAHFLVRTVTGAARAVRGTAS